MATAKKTAAANGNGTKGLLKSKTFWFAILGVVAFFLERFGVNLSEETRGAISNEIVEVISLFGIGYGRLKASSTVKGLW